MEVTRKLVAVLYADVAGYSRLTGADEVGTHEQLTTAMPIANTIWTASEKRACKGNKCHRLALV